MAFFGINLLMYTGRNVCHIMHKDIEMCYLIDHLIDQYRSSCFYNVSNVTKCLIIINHIQQELIESIYEDVDIYQNYLMCIYFETQYITTSK